MSESSTFLNRGTGLIIIEVVNSNPNGDPDRENDPRMRPDGRGEISPVSLKRKLRDLVLDKKGPVWRELGQGLKEKEYDIFERKGLTHDDLVNAVAEKKTFLNKYWDARVFGNTILQESENTPIQTGVAQFGLGVSVSPIFIERLTTTRVTPVQEAKTRGMAPLSFRVVQHAVYCMPFFINATMAKKTNCSKEDIDLLLRLIPYAYIHTASYLRPQVNIRHAFYIEHNSPIGRFNDFEVIESLIPKRIGDEGKPSTSWSDYDAEGLREQWAQVKKNYLDTGKAKRVCDLVQEMEHNETDAGKATENTLDFVQEMEHDETSNTPAGAK